MNIIRINISILLTIGLSILISGCEKNDFELTKQADEFFFLRNKGADMPVWVSGNTASKTFILFLHGGPGDSALGAKVLFDFAEEIEQSYAMVYWDQRSSGSAQGHFDNDLLSIDQFVDDLDKLVVLLKNKYGSDMKLFLMGHSWGGHLGNAYLIDEERQSKIDGWINIDGGYSFSKIANHAKPMLIENAIQQIALSNNIAEWTEILEWCQSKDTLITHHEILQINKFGHIASSLLRNSIAAGITPSAQDFLNMIFFSPVSNLAPGANRSPNMNNFVEEIVDIDVYHELKNVTIPSLFMVGKFDFIVPPLAVNDAFQKIGAGEKEMVIFEHSGHSPYISETLLFNRTVINFVEQYR